MPNKKMRAFEAAERQRVIDSVLFKSEISYLLYHADVLNTGCQQNEGMEDEYEKIASWISDELNAGNVLSSAISNTLTDLFDEETALEHSASIAAILAGSESERIKLNRKSVIAAIHASEFPECYDFVYDSSSEAKLRRRGGDPMSEDYRAAWQNKRLRLGLSIALNSPDTERYAQHLYSMSSWVSWPKVG
jgi:hypothetical protein